MSGHSKWASIKHKKGAADVKRGKLFSKLVKTITIAARDGGGDPKNNPTLATAIEKAKENSMPAENIDRAIKRGTGEIEGVQYEQITYEGYGPNGVALLVEVTTDNKNRSVSEVRSILTRAGGSMGAQGSVSWMFQRKGVILVPKDAPVTEEQLFDMAVEAGAEDMNVSEDHYEIVTEPAEFESVKKTLAEKGVPISSSELSMVPQSTVKLDKEGAKKVLRLVDALEELDDVQEVYANFDIPDDVLEDVAGSL